MSVWLSSVYKHAILLPISATERGVDTEGGTGGNLIQICAAVGRQRLPQLG